MLIRPLLRVTPWWLWALIAAALVATLSSLGLAHYKLREEISAARIAPPVPEPLQGATTIPGADNLLSEFDSEGVVTDMGRFSELGVSWLWVLFGPASGEGASIVLVLAEGDETDYFAAFNRLKGAAATVSIRGFLEEDSGDRRRITQFLQLKGARVPPLLGMTRSLFIDREAELDAKLRNSLIGVLLMAAAALVAATFAVMRFRKWRRLVGQRAHAREAGPAVQSHRKDAGNRAGRRGADTGERFASSPIESRPRGILSWFSR